jgi:hypothetical protein
MSKNTSPADGGGSRAKPRPTAPGSRSCTGTSESRLSTCSHACWRREASAGAEIPGTEAPVGMSASSVTLRTPVSSSLIACARVMPATSDRWSSARRRSRQRAHQSQKAQCSTGYG